MQIKDGIVPAVLGTVVTATGVALRNTNLPESYRNGIIGFGLANIALGSAELVSSNWQHSRMMGKMAKMAPFK
ncbi:MAG TPA: asparagine synthase [Sedimentibacter sp.]|nr:asparagine synthase [Sedimentibacter sp.]HNZ82473.1 asparagine synthase [Sedimentibacter sp.]HOH69564.1 asparagine synthase [Sedimentibacter sp.]HQB63034.1 asparagine synthase [Sedimentibacter sp.]